MLLKSTTDKISLIVSVDELDINTCYTERDQITGDVDATKHEQKTVSGAGTHDIVAAPASNKDRQVEFISIRNVNASAPIDIIIQYNANSVLYELHAISLRKTESVSWTLEGGWIHKKKLDQPFYARRVTQQQVTSTEIGDGSDRGIAVAKDCQFTVPVSDSGGLVRVLSAFIMWSDLSAITTTGVGVQFMMPSPGFSSSGSPRIEACVASVTAATLSAMGGSTGVDAVAKNGTSAVAALPGFGQGWTKWTEGALGVERPHCAYLGLQSEITASLATLVHANFEVFEATD